MSDGRPCQQSEITPDRRQLRSFGLLTGSGFGALALFSHHESFRFGFGALALSLVVLAFTWPPLLRFAYSPWMALAHVLGWINTRILLAVVFYTVFAPVGLVRRLLRRDSLRLKFDKGSSTYRIKSDDSKSRHSLERTF